jgi:hypothetical protein
MKTGTYFILHSQTVEQENALIAFAKALKMEFTTTKEKPYNTEFVAKIKKSRDDFSRGKGTPITLDQINELWK